MRVVSLFSGAGGLDLGIALSGHELVFANDVDCDAVRTYRRNIGPHVLHASILDVRAQDVPDCDVIAAGIPCQGFSVANTKRTLDDPRNHLYREFLRITRAKAPKYTLLENVRGLVTFHGGKVLGAIKAELADLGYRVKHKLLCAADYGVPQLRYRVVILGTRRDLPAELEPGFPTPTHFDPDAPNPLGARSWVTVGEALRNLPDPDGPHDLANHTYSKYKLRFNGYLGHRVVDPHRPSPTVTARGDDRGGVVVLHHPSNQRRMTARELATVQSFPVDFVFEGTQSSVYRQIGNAVPVLMAQAIGREFSKVEQLDEIDPSPCEAVRQLSLALGDWHSQ
ncbi:MAG: DNA cytosine methyltransferase [Armatimonadota bacterium]